MPQETPLNPQAAGEPPSVPPTPAPRGPHDPAWLAFCEEVERMNKNRRYIGQGASTFKLVPPHYYAVMLDTVTNGRGGFISFSQPVTGDFQGASFGLSPIGRSKDGA